VQLIFLRVFLCVLVASWFQVVDH